MGMFSPHTQKKHTNIILSFFTILFISHSELIKIIHYLIYVPRTIIQNISLVYCVTMNCNITTIHIINYFSYHVSSAK